MSIPWQPSASIATLQQRAHYLAVLRQFFAERKVLEVETPLLCKHGVTDPYMDLISAEHPSGAAENYWLQSSPEYAMKRLLAAGSGPIYQICKAFRRGEISSKHNPEFTLVEWYRPGFDHMQLMDEIADLLSLVLASNDVEKISYGELFQQYFSIDPHHINAMEIECIARQHRDIQMRSDNPDDWLNVLLAEIIEPELGIDRPIFIYDYPASQAALAKCAVNSEGVLVAQRFELYVQGIELANGYFELTDSREQRQRIKSEQILRKQMRQPEMASDQFLSAAMDAGLAECAGVALGFDRLMMLAIKAQAIDEVLSFPVHRA